MDNQQAALKPVLSSVRASSSNKPPEPESLKEEVCVYIHGKISELTATDTGYRFNLMRAAADEFSHPAVFPIYSKISVGKEGDVVGIWCRVVCFSRKVEGKRGQIQVFRDVRLFAAN